MLIDQLLIEDSAVDVREFMVGGWSAKSEGLDQTYLSIVFVWKLNSGTLSLSMSAQVQNGPEPASAMTGLALGLHVKKVAQYSARFVCAVSSFA